MWRRNLAGAGRLDVVDTAPSLRHQDAVSYTTLNQVACSAQPECQVERPATSDVRAGAAQMAENGGVGAAGLFQRVGEDGEAVEGALVVDRSGDVGDWRL